MKKEKELDDFARRRAERQKRIRKRRLLIFFVFFIFAMLATGVALSLTVFFPIENISASGSKVYDSQKIIGACGVAKGDNLFRFSSEQLEAKLRKKLPYVESVKVKRSLPGTVKITVTDAAEFACYTTADGCYVISKSGFVLNQYESPPENVFEVKCSTAILKLGSQISFSDKSAQKIITELTENLLNYKIPVDFIDVNDKINISAGVDGRFTVLFGTSNDMDKKIAHLASMIKSIETGKTGKIDLSMWTSDKTQGSFIEGKR